MVTLALSLLFFLSAGWLWTRVLTGAAERAFGPTGHSVASQGGVLRYLEAGAADGRAIVLIHGAFGGAEDWSQTLLEEVGARGRALAFDRPGHGWSSGDPRGRATPRAQAAALAEGVRELGIERPVVVGFSYGAAVALAWALDHPDQLSGLLLVAPVSHPWPGGADFIYRLVGVPLLGELLAATWLTPAAHLRRESGARAAFDPEAVPASFRSSPVPLAISSPRLMSNSEDLRRLHSELVRQAPRYGELNLPVAIVQGLGDRTVTPEIHARALARELPDARLVELSGAGHPLAYARPGELLAALDDLLARIDGSAESR